MGGGGEGGWSLRRVPSLFHTSHMRARCERSQDAELENKQAELSLVGGLEVCVCVCEEVELSTDTLILHLPFTQG